MKKILFVFIALFITGILSYGQNSESINTNPFPKDASGNISLTFIHESNLTSSTLFRNAKTWIATSSISTKSRTYTPKITMEDPQTGRIIVEFTDYTYSPGRYGNQSMTVYSSFKITFDCKDKRYRYKIEDYLDILKYGESEYIKTFDKLHNDYEKENKSMEALNLRNFFDNISLSIQKTMSINDDF